MDQRIPAVLQPLLEEYAWLIQREPQEEVEALYLVGSIALDGFTPA